MENETNQLKRLVHSIRAAATQSKVDHAFFRFVTAAKGGFDPNQPRHPPGRPDGGRWSGSSGFSDIVSAARRIGNSSKLYSSCIDLCYPLLERPQFSGSDINLWDYHKCLNLCLNR
jgi:hypothetical protein